MPQGSETTAASSHDAVHMGVAAWAAWAPGFADVEAWQEWDGGLLPADDGSAPEVKFVDALLRRRLGRLTRMALHVAHECAAGRSPAATVFASRHGELARSVGLLHAIAGGELPSPAAFSLSVHNTAAGIHSIVHHDHAPSSAIAAGEESLLWALVEAATRLRDLRDAQEAGVLLVFADETLPDEYAPWRPSGEATHALALWLVPGRDLTLSWRPSAEACDAQPAPAAQPLTLALLACGLGRRPELAWSGERVSVEGRWHA